MSGAQTSLLVPNSLASGFCETNDTEEAAVLRTMGCDPIEGAACRVIHDKHNPYGSGRGEVAFALDSTSSTWSTFNQSGAAGRLPTAALRKAYGGDGAEAVMLDDLISQIQDKELRAKIQNALPLCLAHYGRAFMANRRDCMGMIRDHAPHIATGRNRRGRKFAIDVRNQELARKWDC